jgi:hypothetical protein
VELRISLGLHAEQHLPSLIMLFALIGNHEAEGEFTWMRSLGMKLSESSGFLYWS